jgi:two-component system, chemotaxis family, protein-glutamate methylesterase/glutaminase
VSRPQDPALGPQFPETPLESEPRVVIGLGASAGGLAALTRIIERLPQDLPAALVVVLHLAATSYSVLAEILGRAGDLHVVAPEEPVAIVAGEVYVARPNRHLLVEPGIVRPTSGPRENGHRPAVDPMLRSLADAYGPRAVGVVLSGTRDDGTAGLGRIKARGGVALVQDPAEALYDGMPRSAIQDVVVDEVLPTAELAERLIEIAREGGHALMSDPRPQASGGAEVATRLTCPDCGGVLIEHEEQGIQRYRCSVGHAFSPESLQVEHAHMLERTVWAAARIVDDRAALMRDMARRAERRGQQGARRRYLERAAEMQEHASVLRALVERASGDADDAVEELAE